MHVLLRVSGTDSLEIVKLEKEGLNLSLFNSFNSKDSTYIVFSNWSLLLLEFFSGERERESAEVSFFPGCVYN